MTARLPQPLLDVYEWQGRGACRQEAVGLFFDSDAHRGASRAAHENAAKDVCRRCPVLAQCRAHGLACEDYGIWGGLTAKERVAIRAQLDAGETAAHAA